MSWRDQLLSNVWLKVFALVLATLIWFSVRLKIDRAIPPPPASNTTKLVFPDQPVRLLTDPAGTGRWRPVPARVSVTVSGEPNLLDKLDPGEVQVFVQPLECPGGGSGTNKVQVFTPPGVSLYQVSPLTVRLQRVPP